MGFFSWDCSCGHPLLSIAATNSTNRWMNNSVALVQSDAPDREPSVITGRYDGYGRIAGVEIFTNDDDFSACVYHRPCWEKAGRPTTWKASPSSQCQGWFFPDGLHNMEEPQ